MALIFILNRSFVPYRKWRPRDFAKLTYKPPKFEGKLRKILTTVKWTGDEFENKQGISTRSSANLQKSYEKPASQRRG